MFKIAQIYLQKDFEKNTEIRIKRRYGINQQETIFCGIWIKKFSRQGFVLTNKALYWDFKLDSEKNYDNVVKETGEQVFFSIYDGIVENREQFQEDFFSKLEIKTTNETKVIYFNRLNENQKQTLTDLLNFGFNHNELPQRDLSPSMILKQNSKLQNVFDGIRNGIYSCKKNILGKICLIKDSIKKRQTQYKNTKQLKKELRLKTKEEKIKLKEEQLKNQQIRKEKLFSIIFANFCDVLASLIFIAAIVIALKPELLGNSFYYEPRKITKDVIDIAGHLFNFSITEKISSEILFIRNFWITVFMLGFVVLKFLVIVTKKSLSKVATLLLLCLTLLSTYLLSENFLIFVLFSLILYICFEILCNFSRTTIITKCILLVIVSCNLYFLAHVLFFPGVREIIQTLASNFGLLWSQLSLPIIF